MKYLIIVLIVFGGCMAQAQSKFKLQGQIKGLNPKSQLTLFYVKGGQLTPIDTAAIDSTGTFVFQSNEPIPVSMGAIVGLTRGYFELFLDTPAISFVADIKDIAQTIKFKNSPENTVFFAYNNRIKNLYVSTQSKTSARNASKQQPSVTKNYQAEFSVLRSKLTDSVYKKHPQMLCTRFLKSLEETKLPVLPVSKLSRADSVFLAKYKIEHVFDNSFLNDKRMANTMSVPMRLTRLMSETPKDIPTEDLKALYSKLIDQTKGNNDIKKTTIRMIIQKYEFSSSPELDNFYEFLKEKYIITVPELWEASVFQQLKEIKEAKTTMAVGNFFPMTIDFATLSNQPVRLVEIPAIYTVLFFYDPNCSRCQQEIPIVSMFAQKMQDANKNVAVLAVTTNPDKRLMTSFVQQMQLSGALNHVKINNEMGDLQKIGVYRFPTIFVIDNNSRIVARYLEAEELMPFIEKKY